MRRKPRTTGSKRSRSHRLAFETLEPRLVLDGLSLVINEMMAANGTTLLDEDGDSSDWVEIYNPTDGAWSGAPVSKLGVSSEALQRTGSSALVSPPQ